jgi:hypothetical protein
VEKISAFFIAKWGSKKAAEINELGFTTSIS